MSTTATFRTLWPPIAWHPARLPRRSSAGTRTTEAERAVTASLLEQLGWTAGWARAFEPHASTGLVPGRVTLEHNHVFRVATAEGEYLAETAGTLKHEADGRLELPVVGDWVGLRL